MIAGATAVLAALPRRVRVTFYAALILAGVTLGAFQVGYTAAEAPIPVWLKVALAVVAYVASVGGGATALANVPADAGDHRR